MAQWIGHQPPELGVQVRFPPGARVVGPDAEVERLGLNLGKNMAKVVGVLVFSGLSGTRELGLRL